MASREPIAYFTPSVDGQGLEGFMSWSNSSMGYWLIPIFLGVFYGLAIYMATKNEYKLGGQIALYSLVFFFLGMIAQTFTQFNQMVMFFFAIGIVVGVVMSFIENAKG